MTTTRNTRMNSALSARDVLYSIVQAMRGEKFLKITAFSLYIFDLVMEFEK